jgi:hypothetical protein
MSVPRSTLEIIPIPEAVDPILKANIPKGLSSVHVGTMSHFVLILALRSGSVIMSANTSGTGHAMMPFLMSAHSAFQCRFVKLPM